MIYYSLAQGLSKECLSVFFFKKREQGFHEAAAFGGSFKEVEQGSLLVFQEAAAFGGISEPVFSVDAKQALAHILRKVGYQLGVA
jgi:hypothetical protein